MSTNDITDVIASEPNEEGYREFTLGHFHFRRDEYFAHTAARCGERHGDMRNSLAILAGREIAVVYQTEFHDVDGYLWVIAGFHLLPHQTFYVIVSGVGWQLQRCADFFAKRVGIATGNTKQISFDVDGKTTAQRLRNEAGLTGAQGNGDTRRNHNGFDVVLNGDGFVIATNQGKSLLS